MKRPFRFLTSGGPTRDREAFVHSVRQMEALGFSTLGMPDHFWLPFAPLVAAQAAADATTMLRVTQTVLDQDFRHPAVLAKELATLDVLSDGRLEIGLGAGWHQDEYARAGILFDAASVRIERLEEVVLVLKGLFTGEPFTFGGKHFKISDLVGSPLPVQRPHPPIMIGGGGRKLLAVAARHADIVQVMPIVRGDASHVPSEFTGDVYRRKVDWIAEIAGSRFDDIELGGQLLALVVTDGPLADGELTARFPTLGRAEQELGRAALEASPLVAVGSLDDVCEKLLDTRERFGISYFAAPNAMKPRLMAPVIERLRGT